jgi:hypothetical protein
MKLTLHHNMDDCGDDAQARFTPVSHSRTSRNIDFAQDYAMDTSNESTQATSTPVTHSQTPKRAVSDELALDWVAPPPAKRSRPSNFRVVVPTQAYPTSLYSSDQTQRRDQNTERWALPRLLVSLLLQLFSASRVSI